MGWTIWKAVVCHKCKCMSQLIVSRKSKYVEEWNPRLIMGFIAAHFECNNEQRITIEDIADEGDQIRDYMDIPNARGYGEPYNEYKDYIIDYDISYHNIQDQELEEFYSHRSLHNTTMIKSFGKDYWKNDNYKKLTKHEKNKLIEIEMNYECKIPLVK